MGNSTEDLFGTARADERRSKHVSRTEALMRRLAEKGLTLEQLADRRVMARSLTTLQKYARQFGMTFPDYVPMKLRPKKNSKLKVSENA